MDDNTSLIRMKRDFDQFMQDHNDSRRALVFSLDDKDDTTNISNDQGAISVQALLEKEKYFKMKEAEFIAAKSQIVRLESKLASLETANKRAKLDHEQELEIMHSECFRESQRVSDLHSKVKLLEEKECQSRESLTETLRETDRQRMKYEEQILSLQKEKMQLSDDLQQEREQNWETISEMKSELMRNDTELRICQNQLEETKVQLKLQIKRSADITSKMKDYEELRLKSSQAEQKIKDLELHISRMEEDSLIVKNMKSQLTTFQEMEKENRKLKDENHFLRETQENNMLLKEQNEAFEKKVKRLEGKFVDYNKLVVDNEELKCRLHKWENAEKFGIKIRSPSDLCKRVVDLQNSEAVLLSKQGDLQTSLHLNENTLRDLQEQGKSLQQQLLREKSKVQQDNDLIKRLKRKLLLVTKERDGYKRIIDSYESEVTMTIGTDSAGSLSHVQQLEESVQGYKEQTEWLELELMRVNEQLANAQQFSSQMQTCISESSKNVTHGSMSESDQQIVLQLRERIASLEKSLEKCEQDKFALECRIEQRQLQGDYDPSKIKVLHLKQNPADTALAEHKEALQKLKHENERLKQRILLLEENEGKIENLTVAVEQKLKEPGSSKDIEEMRSQLATAELKNKRLIEAFKKTSQEVREVCYQLTGYRIDIPTPNQYRLTSMYAESPNDMLFFKQSSGGVIEMLGTSFSSTMQHLIDMYLTRQDSIPAFLSSVTLELFGRQTVNFS